MQEQTTERILLQARQEIADVEQPDDDSLVGIFKKASIHAIDTHINLVSGLNNLVVKRDDQERDLCKFD